MLMGPVFRAELLRTARQRRYYAMRLAYGLLLLVLVWTGYEQMRQGQPVTHLSDIATFATDTFVAFAVVQLITVLSLVPPVFGGAIADEKQRKTLHYLMASQLSSGEILLDKLLGRSAHLAVFVAIGLPVVSLLGLFGGISAESVVVAYVGTFSTVAFAIAMTLLVSTMARRVRDAILSAYLLMLMWLLVPPLILLFGSAFKPQLYFWIQPVNEWLADTSPAGLLVRSRLGMVFGLSAGMFDRFVWMVGSQLAGAVLLLMLAIWRLRPTFRRHEESSPRRSWFRAREGRRHRRWPAHPDCGDDPILWKERFFAPVDRFTRLVLLPAIVVITLPLVLLTEVEGHFSRILVELAIRGSEVRRLLPEGFLWMLQIDLGWYVAFWLLAVAGASASSVTVEREKDTWVSLTSTPLTGGEILRGKVLGALWHQRGFAVVLIFLWALGLLTGAVHPLGVLASMALVALLTWFVATVGVYSSLRASSTSRALTSALAILAGFNGYPVILLLWFMGSMSWESSYSALGAMPTLAGWSLVSPRSFDSAWGAARAMASLPPIRIFLAGMTLSVLCIYAASALALTRRIVGHFDRWLDRPPLSGVAAPADDMIIMPGRPDRVVPE
jgi:ABC-type transport system involved in multi-copper enzyme maturation permease subunit